MTLRKPSKRAIANGKPKQSSRSKPKASLKHPARNARSRARSLYKKNRVVAMLRVPEGTTIAAIVKATGWKQHTVRGFFSAVIRRKLHLELVSEIKDGARVYRIIEP